MAEKTENSENSEDWKNQLISSYKEKASKDGGDWLTKLKKKSQESVAAKLTFKLTAEQLDKVYLTSMTRTVDRMFDMFDNYIMDFNQAVRGTYLEVIWERPELFTDTLRKTNYQESSQIQLFKGHLSTRSWTMLIRGFKNKIEVYVIPAEKVLSVTVQGTIYEPYMVMTPYFDEGEVQWQIDGVDITEDLFKEVCEELFAALIRFAQGEAKQGEKFSLRGAKQGFGRQTLAGIKALPTSSLEPPPSVLSESSEPQVELLKEDLGGGKPATAGSGVKAHGNVFDDGDALQKQRLTGTVPAAKTEQKPGKKAEKKQAKGQPGKAGQKAGGKAPGKSVDDKGKPGLADSAEAFLSAIDDEIAAASKKGADAFAGQDLAGAEAALKISNRLKEFKKKVDTLVDECKSIIEG